MNGVLVVNKPEGFTSFDVVAVLRGVLKTKKIGHAGTLDPMATGVLPVLVGRTAKACDLLPDTHKSYRAGFQLGVTTDTLDRTGRVVHTSNCKVDQETLLAVLPRFRGDIMQVPPMYAAIKIDGKKLYELARKGVEIERPARQVTISRLELLDFDPDRQTGTVEVTCSKGTYIRSLIDDIGTTLSCGAVMTDLVRTEACGFTLDDAHELSSIKELGEAAQKLLIPTHRLFLCYPAVLVSEAQARRFENGGALSIDRLRGFSAQGIIRVYFGKRFLGLGMAQGDAVKVHKLFFE